jgi:uncharacterized protein YjiS (DUF1127 family)
MAVIAPAIRRPLRLGLFAVEILRRIGKGLVSRRSIGHVRDLDERLLRDIGLTRQDDWPRGAEPLFRDVPVGSARGWDHMRAGMPLAASERRALAELRRWWTQECGTA